MSTYSAIRGDPIAMAITLTVVEPTCNGIGSDAFALFWDSQLHGLNAAGKSPQNLTKNYGSDLKELPIYGWTTVTVPGAVSAWRSLWQKWAASESRADGIALAW